MSDNYPMFSWLSAPSEDDDAIEAYVSIHPTAEHGPGRTHWEVTTENVIGDTDGTTLDDDAVSAWNTVAYIMCEHGATSEETDGMVAAAPANLGWCFDGQVGMYAYDKNEEWDG